MVESSDNLKTRKNTLLLCLIDVAAINIAYFIAVYASNPHMYDSLFSAMFSIIISRYIRTVTVTAAFLIVFKMFGLYNSIWKYAGIYEMSQIAVAVFMGSISSIGIDKIGNAIKLPGMFNSSGSVYITYTLTIVALVGGVRLFYRALERREYDGVDFDNKKIEKRVMIVGAGTMGMLVVEDLQAHGYRLGRPVVMLDDDINKQGKRLRGIPVRGGCENIPELAKKYAIDEITLCIPNATPERQIEVIKIAMETGCILKTSPSLLEMAEGKNNKGKTRNVEITDLLPRSEVKLDTRVCGYLMGQVVLITGGGGSIGSELCRQVAKYEPESIIIFDNYENNAFTLKNQLDNLYNDTPKVVIRIGSVQDENRLREVFEEFRPTVVFHAAAHKHVPLMEESPCEAIKNNIFGTYNTARTAMEFGVKKFIILSTDKAVNPTNVMGATKRVTEKIVQYLDRNTTGTRFAAVRFGNVLGSNGSVIPIFKEQIERGGPVMVTDASVTRYFMTIPEAAQLVVQAGGIAKGGEVFILDMGEPVKILTLAENLIKLSGFTPYVDIDIKFTGLRPGEKMYEELSLAEEMEGRQRTSNNQIFVTTPLEFDEKFFLDTIEELRAVNTKNARCLLKKIVPNYVEAGECQIQ